MNLPIGLTAPGKMEGLGRILQWRLACRRFAGINAYDETYPGNNLPVEPVNPIGSVK